MKENSSQRPLEIANAWMITQFSMFSKKSLLTLSLVASLAALTSGQTKFVKKSPIKIGYSVFDMQQPYWQAYTKGVQDACKAAGYEFILSDQKSNQQAEVSGSIDLINQGISALINSPIEPAALPAVIDKAHQGNIPVIIGDVGVAGKYDAFVVSNNEEGGKLAAQYMIEHLKDKSGTKEVLVIELHPGAAVGGPRTKGFVDEIKQHSDYKIVASLNGNDTVQGGYQATQNTLSANPNLAGIYATNDPEAEGAVQALKAAGKNGVKDVFLVGFNGDPPALELIKKGEMAATIRQDPYGQGQKCVELATKFMNNETVEYSDPATKSVFFPVKVIDKENVDQFIQK
ncbi:MAG: substrate-binding domain-containing protein [Verrucomicrobia bacterium]|nr:substrate-binding domain-containing protein [Verrucomicrobiota bacterium]MBV9300127.1 substrate-binding domain-containing protein [Verrucomicrobiota bacterium]